MVHTKNRLRSEFIVCLFLVVVIILAYLQLPSHDFLGFDDNEYITQNIHVQKGITLENIVWAFGIIDFAYWHPLTWLSHMLVFQIFGMNPFMHHLINLFLHIANVLLLFLVFKRMTGSLWKSAFVAALFALHPLNVETVAWASERKNVLSTFFWILTMFTYVLYAERPGFYRYLMTFLVFALGLMAKPMLVTLPFVLILLDYWPLCRFKLSQSGGMGHGIRQSILSGSRWSPVLRLFLEKVPFLSLSAVCIYLSSLSVQHLGIVISTASVPMKLRIYNALVSYVSYIKKMVWPHNLAVYYPYPESIPFWKVAGAAVFLVCVSILVFRALRSKPYLAVGWLWYMGTLVPAIGLIQAGLWPAIADRFSYVPLIGLFIVIAWGIPDLVDRWRYKKIVLAITATALVLIFMATTWFQNRHWQNSIVLFKHALDVTNDNDVAHQKLGEALAAQGKTDEAIRHYYEALRIKPDLVAARLNLGVTLREEGKINEAIEHFSMALQAKPDCAEAYYELGIALEKKGNIDGAEEHYIKALRIKPDYAKAHNNLGIVLARQKKDKDAIFHFYEALRIDSDFAGAYYNLGIIYANQRNIEKAILYYKKALHFNPNMAQALYNLSWILSGCEDDRFRNGEGALKLAEKLCKITRYHQPPALDALAVAYAETGKFDKAVAIANKALELALKQGTNEIVVGLKKRLQLYQAGHPYRQIRAEEGSS